MTQYSQIQKKVLVIGHKNPDTDSICSAICYSHLKNSLGEKLFEPARAGDISEETKFVLNYYNVPKPKLCTDVSVQLKDIELSDIEGVNDKISLKEAWTLMRDSQIDTLPIVNNQKKLLGLITVKVIATSYMDIYNSNILALSQTPYDNILKTIDGKMEIGDIKDKVTKGKIIIAASNPDSLENIVKKGDIVILENRCESQLCAIKMNAGCIIVCMNSPISEKIKNLCKEHNCKLIVTPYDTYKVARLISQSTPISYFMKRDSLITFDLESTVDEATAVMAKVRHRYFPVLNNDGKYYCMLSRRNLLNKQCKQLILVDHNEKTQAVNGIEEAEVLEIIDHHRIGNLETSSPIYFMNYPLGSTATIIYSLYKQNRVDIPKKIAGLLCSAIISDTLMFRSPTCTKTDENAAAELAKIAEIKIQEFADQMFYAGSNIKNKTPKEIFYSDFKIFTFEDIRFGIGQSNFMNNTAIENAKEPLSLFLPKALETENIDMVFYMLTNIVDESTKLMYCGKQAETLINHVFGEDNGDGTVLLTGVVSRKKQLVPALMNDIAQMQ